MLYTSAESTCVVFMPQPPFDWGIGQLHNDFVANQRAAFPLSSRVYHCSTNEVHRSFEGTRPRADEQQKWSCELVAVSL